MKSHYNKWFVLPFMLLFFLIGGCEKEDYILPVEFKLNFTIKNEAILGGSLMIDEIGLGLNSIDIRGSREQGDDVFLTRNFANEKNFIIKPTSANITDKLDYKDGVLHSSSENLNQGKVKFNEYVTGEVIGGNFIGGEFEWSNTDKKLTLITGAGTTLYDIEKYSISDFVFSLTDVNGVDKYVERW